VTLSGLLNALDGIATPHGLVTVMTTNAPEALDPAVIRPGRVDLTETFGLADAGQAARLVSHYYGVPLDAADASGTAEVAPAEVIEACKRHDYPLDALASLGARGMLARGAA
jgi:mitochondrial chaperone BCS1